VEIARHSLHQHIAVITLSPQALTSF